jgi:uncharacterized protein YjbI with pentapeptide repeats
MADIKQLKRLKRSVVEWNAWRREHHIAHPNLNHADLSNADLTGAKLTGARLVRSLLIGTRLVNANLSSARLNIANMCDFTHKLELFMKHIVSSR